MSQTVENNLRGYLKSDDDLWMILGEEVDGWQDIASLGRELESVAVAEICKCLTV